MQISNVTCLRHALPMGRDINKVLVDLDSAIAKAIDAAKAADKADGGRSPQPRIAVIRATFSNA